MKNVIDFLKATRRLVERPEAWTQDVYARAQDGRPLASHDGWAVCWCLTGAISHIATKMSGGADYLRRHALRLLNCVLTRETSEPNTLASWNDEPTRKHVDILALIDKAIRGAIQTVSAIALTYTTATPRGDGCGHEHRTPEGAGACLGASSGMAAGRDGLCSAEARDTVDGSSCPKSAAVRAGTPEFTSGRGRSFWIAKTGTALGSAHAWRGFPDSIHAQT